MLNRLKALFAGEDDRPDDGQAVPDDDTVMAVAALMVEAAGMDGHVAESERERIRLNLARRFDLTTDDTSRILEKAETRVSNSEQIFPFTSTLRARLTEAERTEIVEMMWDVVYADGDLDDFEANLIRRVTGLLHVPDAEAGEARKRVLARRSSGG